MRLFIFSEVMNKHDEWWKMQAVAQDSCSRMKRRVRSQKAGLTETPTFSTVINCAGWSLRARSSLD